MKVTDLMIGDWVNYRPGWINEETGKVEWESHDEGLPVKIEFLYFCHGEGFVQYNDGENDGIEAADYELFPIPLTPEILEKNGFRKGCYVGGYYSPDCPFRVFTKKEGKCGFTTLFDDEIHFSCIFVHQLQHALRLYGIEKEIVL